VRVTPYARRLAAELGVDVAAVGPGADGAVHAAQVRAAVPPATSATSAAPAPRTARRPGRVPTRSDPRALTAALMARSKREIPHYYLELPIDLEPALRWMEERNRALPLERRLVPAALMLKASAVAAARVPELNGFWVDDTLRPAPEVNLGVAVSLRGGGLAVPAIRRADGLAVEDLMARLKELVTRARGGRLRSSEVGIATLTVTNLGDRGVEAVHGVIHPPQVALVGFGAVAPRPWAVDGLLGVRRLATATLAADHRATDGFTGSRFLTAVDDLLRHPDEL
jgi:pyruvate dehydrogenase E2 component (dihydrolipoamide acetyltransferase)